MSTKNVAMAFGIVYLLIGILGFVLVPGEGDLLGIFRVNTLHNITHVLFGVLGIGAAMTGTSRLYCQVLGVVFILLFLAGLVLPSPVLGLVATNMADNILYLVSGALLLYFGFAASRDETAASRV